MIRLTRLNGSVFSLNPDLIHRAEETPDTVLTLIDGSRYVVTESLAQIVDSVVAYRARVVAEANRLAAEGTWVPDDEDDDEHARRAGDTEGTDGAAGAEVVELRTRRA